MLDPDLPTLSRLLDLSAASRPDRGAKEARWPELLQLAAAAPAAAGAAGSEPWRIKVAGTNGKGSVAAMLEACLAAAGLRVGLFTSPHLLRPTERLRIAGREVRAARLEALARELEPRLRAFIASRGPAFLPSFFEILVLISRVLFRREGVQVAVYEAGLGGSNDVVSRLPAPLSILTSVDDDHAPRLGSTLGAIARDKVGIADEGSILVVGPSLPAEARQAVEEEAAVRGLCLVDADAGEISALARRPQGTEVRLAGSPQLGTLRIPLPGGFQLANFACVVAAVRALVATGRLSAAGCLGGVAATRWPGRCQHVPGTPAWLLDGAHNPAALRQLAAVVEEHFATRPRLLLFGTSRADGGAGWQSLLGRLAGEVCLAGGFHHAQSAGELARRLGGALAVRGVFATPEAAVAELRSAPWAARRLIVVTGSLYLVGKVGSLVAAAGASPGGPR